MQLLAALSLLRNDNFKVLSYQISRYYCRNTTQPQVAEEKLIGDPSYVEILPSWSAADAPGLRAAVLRDLRVVPAFVSAAEEDALLEELEPVLRRMRYEYDHWDNAIEGFRETERAEWSPANAAVLSRVRAAALGPRLRALPHVHVLDLAPTGHIKPHVDAVRFCGSVIAGLSLCSDAVMRLEYAGSAGGVGVGAGGEGGGAGDAGGGEAVPSRALVARLARRSLYIMRDTARYQFSHAVSRDAGHAARRVSLICRSEPRPCDTQ